MAIVPLNAMVAETTEPPPGAITLMMRAERLAKRERGADVRAQAGHELRRARVSTRAPADPRDARDEPRLQRR